jgi:hypothetical protein
MKIRGEYWIQGGQVDFADGDVGDQNHEMVALNHIASEHLDGLFDYAEELGVETEDFDRYSENPSSTASELLGSIHHELTARGVASVQVAPEVISKLGINAETYKMLGGGGDARLYVMKNEGWIAIRSNNIELFGYDANKKRQLASGLEDILDQEGIDEPDEQIEFSLYDHRTNRSSDVTLADIKNTNAFARPQQLPNTTYNKALLIPPDRRHPMGSQSPRTMTVQQRQAIQTSEGSLGFRHWLGKSKPKSFIVRRTWPSLSEQCGAKQAGRSSNKDDQDSRRSR